MPTKTDERGRIYLPAGVRERYGEEYRIVEFPDRLVLLPVDDDPLDGLHTAVGDAFEDMSREDLAAAARRKARAHIAEEPNGEA